MLKYKCAWNHFQLAKKFTERVQRPGKELKGKEKRNEESDETWKNSDSKKLIKRQRGWDHAGARWRAHVARFKFNVHWIVVGVRVSTLQRIGNRQFRIGWKRSIMNAGRGNHRRYPGTMQINRSPAARRGGSPVLASILFESNENTGAKKKKKKENLLIWYSFGKLSSIIILSLQSFLSYYRIIVSGQIFKRRLLLFVRGD